jgi:chromosome segregation ATPase
MNTTTNDHESRLAWLEQKVRHDLSGKVDSMSWGIGQIYASNEATRMDQAALRAGLAHLEITTHAEAEGLKATLDQRASELREKLGTTEASFLHDLGRIQAKVSDYFNRVDIRFQQVDQQLGDLKQWTASADERFSSIDQRFEGVDRRFDAVDKRFEGLDQQLEGVDQRLEGLDQRLDGLDSKLDRVLAAVESRNGGK